MKTLSRLTSLVATIGLLTLPGVASAAGAPVPTIIGPNGTLSNGIYSSYNIPVTANCTDLSAPSSNWTPSNVAGGLSGTHTIEFFYNNTGNVWFTVDGGVKIAFISSCSGTDDNSRSVGGGPFTAAIDTTIPSISVTAPAYDTSYVEGSTVRVSGPVSAGVTGVTVNTYAPTPSSYAAAISNGVYSYNLVLPQIVTSGYTITATATDGLGHSVTTFPTTIRLTAPPSPTSTPVASRAPSRSASPTPAPTSTPTPSPSSSPVAVARSSNGSSSQDILGVSKPVAYGGIGLIAVLVILGLIFRSRILSMVGVRAASSVKKGKG